MTITDNNKNIENYKLDKELNKVLNEEIVKIKISDIPDNILLNNIESVKKYVNIDNYGTLWVALLDGNNGTDDKRKKIIKIYDMLKENDKKSDKAKLNNINHDRTPFLKNSFELIYEIFDNATEFCKKIAINEWDYVLNVDDNMNEIKNIQDYINWRNYDSTMVIAYLMSCNLRNIEYNKNDILIIYMLCGIIVWLHDTMATLRTGNINYNKSAYNYVKCDKRVVLLYVQVITDMIRELNTQSGIKDVFLNYIQAHLIGVTTQPWNGICDQIPNIASSNNLNNEIPSEETIKKTCKTIYSSIINISCPIKDDINNISTMSIFLTKTQEIVTNILLSKEIGFKKNIKLMINMTRPKIVEKVINYTKLHEEAPLSVYYAQACLRGGVDEEDLVDIGVIFNIWLETEVRRNYDNNLKYEDIIDEKPMYDALKRISQRHKWSKEVLDECNKVVKITTLFRHHAVSWNYGKLNKEKDINLEYYRGDSYRKYIRPRHIEGFWKMSEWLSHLVISPTLPKVWHYNTELIESAIIAFEVIAIQRRKNEDGGVGIINTVGTDNLNEAAKRLYLTSCAMFANSNYGRVNNIDSKGHSIYTTNWVVQFLSAPGSFGWYLFK